MAGHGNDDTDDDSDCADAQHNVGPVSELSPTEGLQPFSSVEHMDDFIPVRILVSRIPPGLVFATDSADTCPVFDSHRRYQCHKPEMPPGYIQTVIKIVGLQRLNLPQRQVE